MPQNREEPINKYVIDINICFSEIPPIKTLPRNLWVAYQRFYATHCSCVSATIQKTVAPALYPSNQARNPAPTMGRQKRKKRDEAIKRKWELGEHARDGLAIPQREFVNRLISRYRMQRSEKY